ncbi:MAG: MotA/TolQ/ExbB proton channel family protein [Alphaproteobacteria bacterium]
MNRYLKIIAAAAIAATPLSLAQAQDAPQAPSLDQVLNLVNEGARIERASEQSRVRAFQSARNDQQRLLSEARNERAALQRESERLDQAFDDNEIRITQLEGQLDERQGNLKELFGVVKQNAEDLRGRISGSITSAEMSRDRYDFLNNLAQKRDVELPTIEELRRLWAIYLEEIIATGDVSKFTGTVSTTDGNEERDIVRVGNFNLVSDGKYLNYDFENNRISEYPAQPEGGMVSSAEDLVEATSGPVAFGVDPSRGQILNTLVFIPSLGDRFEAGGIVGKVIAALGIIGLLLVIWRWAVLTLVGGKVNSQMKRDTASTDNPLGRIMSVYEENRGVDVETLELKLDEAILKEVPKIETALGIIKVISVVAPLLGLLGTVVGMILTFQAITLFGAGDPQIMAGGISQALVTTVLGLVVAIPLTLLYTLVASRAKRIIHVLEEQAAGIIAVHAEKHGQQA